MKQYRVQSSPDHVAVMEVLASDEMNLTVRITRRYEDYETSEETVMETQLFDLCLRTGYLTELPRSADHVA